MSSRAVKRIVLDYKEILDDPVEHIHYIHDENNVYKGYGLIIGPKDTPYEYGYYFFDFNFPENYPFSPPKVKFYTYDGNLYDFQGLEHRLIFNIICLKQSSRYLYAIN
jgi:ubiquitin-protein ligase